MGSKRSPEKMAALRQNFFDGMRELHGITGETAERIYEKMAAFANFGFPESHSQSFASLVFYSAWFQAAPSGRILRRIAARPTDGVLLAAVAGRRRPPARWWCTDLI